MSIEPTPRLIGLYAYTALVYSTSKSIYVGNLIKTILKASLKSLLNISIYSTIK
jgi:hypothetical protein